MIAIVRTINTKVAKIRRTRRTARLRALRDLRVLRGVAFWRGDAAAQELRLSLAEAQDRAVAASHRLAEARARAATAEAAVAVRRGRRSSDRRAWRRLHAHEPRHPSSPFPARRPAAGALSGCPEQLPDETRPAVADLQRRPDRCARARGAGGGVGRGRRRGRGAGGPAARGGARVLGGRRRRAPRRRCSTAASRAHRRTSRDVRQRLNAGAGAAQRGRVGRSAGIASADAADRDAQSGRPVVRRTGALDRRRRPADALNRTLTSNWKRRWRHRFDGLVADARSTRDERRALEQRIAAAEEQVAAAEGSSPAFDRHHRRRLITRGRTRTSFRAPTAGTIRGTRACPRRGRSGTAAAPGPKRRQARTVVDAARQRLAEFDSVLALEVRQRLLDIDSGRAALAAADEAVRAATEARRVVDRTLPRRRRHPDRGARRRRRAAAGGARSNARASPACDSPRRGSRGRSANERDRGPAAHAPVRRVRRRQRPQLRSPAGRDLRLPRQQRRRQVDDHPHAVRPAASVIGLGARRRHRRRQPARGA